MALEATAADSGGMVVVSAAAAAGLEAMDLAGMVDLAVMGTMGALALADTASTPVMATGVTATPITVLTAMMLVATVISRGVALWAPMGACVFAGLKCAGEIARSDGPKIERRCNWRAGSLAH